jgi:hypothetical protein
VESILGSYTSSLNPLDMTGYVFHHPDALRAILRQYVADDSCDVVVVGAYMNTPRTSRSVAAASGLSAILTTMTSAISITPALAACTASPAPGSSTSTMESVTSTRSISLWAHAAGLDHYVVVPGGIENCQRAKRRGR